MNKLRIYVNQGVRVDGQSINVLKFAVDDIEFCVEIKDFFCKTF